MAAVATLARVAPPVATQVPPPAASWGRLPEFSLVAACGLLIVSLADWQARQSGHLAELLFWIGLIAFFVPPVARLGMAGVGRFEAVGLVIGLGMGLYLVKLMHSPLQFTFPDEFFHWRTTDDILRSGHLFRQNPMLPVSSLYPGMEIVTSALVRLSGLSIFAAGAIVAGVARFVLILALFLFYERATGRVRVAGLATALHMAHPNFLYFNAAFKYETLSLAFAAFALWALAELESRRGPARRAWILPATVGMAGIAVTHHLTSYVFSGLVFAWGLLAWWLARRQGRRSYAVLAIAVAAILMDLGWLFAVARQTIGYLAPVLTGALTSVLRLIWSEAGQGTETGRQLFQSSSGTVAPLWERLAALGGVGLLLLALPVGLWRIWVYHRTNPIAIVLGLYAALYPATLALRFTGRGWETGNRASASLFVALGLVVAAGVAGYWLDRWRSPWASLPVAGCAGVVFLSGVIAGWPPLWRLPGPYLPAQDPRSIEREGVATAFWTRDELGPDNRLGADRTNFQLLGSYGRQQVSSTLSGGVNVNWILFAPTMGQAQRDLARQGRLRYIVVAKQLADVPGVARSYYSDADVAAALRKFDFLEGIDRIYDSGNLVIYDVGALADGP